MAASFKKYIPLNLSLYEYLYKESQDCLKSSAISFYGKNISYEEMLHNINETVRALRTFGIKKDDVVASSLPGTPEGIYLIYAINKIGAVYCAFDCRAKSDEIEETIKTFSPKLCFVPDFQIKEFKNIKDCYVVHLNPGRSINKAAQIFSPLADLFTGRKYILSTNKKLISYNSFIKAAIDGQDCLPQRATDDIFGYFYTSGTTYGRKSVILTNENINAAVIQQANANPYIEKGNSILNIMPLFTCYSVTVAVHLPLVSGIRVNLIPLLNTKKLKKVLLREKPNYIITVPAHWEYFIKDNFKNCDLSFLKTVIIGGDTMTSNEQNIINNIFKSCNCNCSVTVGYGLSETASTATSCLISSPSGSVGSPLHNTMIKIFDKYTNSFLPSDKKGEICICGPTVCKGYYNDPEMTQRLLKVHSDGNVWLHSGDCGYIDKTGALFFCERIKRMYVRFDGTKISPYSIEKIILSSPLVNKCMVIGIPDKEHSHGMCAKAFIVLNKNISKKKAREQLQNFFRKHMDEHMLPKEIVFVERLPHTKNGKTDYFAVSEK